MSNVFEPEWHDERGGNRVARLAAAAGSQRLGASIVELAPGTLSSPYHFHHANEELLIVLSGTPELRTPDGFRELPPGEVLSFPRGARGAHRLRNATSEPCRILFISEVNFPDIVSYPDTGTTLAVTTPSARLAFPSGSDRPVTDLIAAAFDADPGSAA
ncbi:MAG: cupin domain-containing protein [Solirubrobacteraceae bacterium]